MYSLAEIISYTKSIAQAVVKNKYPKVLDSIKELREKDRKYIIDHLTDADNLKKREYLRLKIDQNRAWKKINQAVKVPIRTINYWKYAAAAVVIMGLASTAYLALVKNTKTVYPDPLQETVTAITPGGPKASLTLGNGQKIVLGQNNQTISRYIHANGNEVRYQDNTPGAISYNYLNVPRGGEYRLVLEDGTVVWINSDSQLKFPNKFIDGQPRKVELLYGEAYFDVSSSKAHKGSHFIVSIDEQDIEVLGTEFNVKAYRNEKHIYTTLVEGRIASSTPEHRTILKPGEQLILNTLTKQIQTAAVNTYYETAWRKGLFAFKNKNLKEITDVLARWYDVKVEFEDPKLENIQFKGVISRKQNLEQILTLIKNSDNINAYEIKDKTIIIKK